MARRVLITRLDSAGDVILATPAIRAVAASGADVTLLCSSQGEPAARLVPDLHEVLVFDAPWVHGSPPPVRAGDLAKLVVGLRRRRFEEALILTSSFQSSLPTALLLRLSGVGRICGISSDYPGSLLDVRVVVEEDLHESQRGAAVAAAAGYPIDGRGPRIRGHLPTVNWAGKRSPYVVVHPGADAPARCWDRDRAREAVELLSDEGFQVVVTGASGERSLTKHVAGDTGVDLGGRTTLAELAAVIKAADALVIGNTGPAHLGAALGVPVVSLFAPVVPAIKWAPFTERLMVLGDQHAACADTRARQCPVPGHPCLSSISANDVLEAVRCLVGTVAA